MADDKKIGTLTNCFFCEYFFITHEVKGPYGCRAKGFKSSRMPAAEVYENTKMDCALFIRKEKAHSHEG